MNTKQIVFTAINTAELLDVEIPELEDDSVVIETAITTISSGTERANIIGDPSVSPKKGAEVKFPRTAGYNCAGIVTAVGPAVTSVKVGDRVVAFWSKHKAINVMPEEKVIKLPDDVSFQDAAISFIASFPMAAIRKTRLEMGESAMVMGLGILGMIAIKLLRVAGAVPVIAVDPNPARRQIALENGADYAFDPFDESFAENVKSVTGGGVNVAIEVTGVGAGFNGALDCMAKFGRVALLGCTRNSDFTVDYYRKIHAPGITVIGAHTIARPESESHPGWFTHRDDITSILKLCSGGRLCLGDLVTETHSPAECGEVFERLVNDRNFPIGVQFDWRMLK